MNASKKRQKWFHALEEELNRYFDQKETEEIIAYYEEMIDDRVEHGELIDNVLSDYDPKEIARQTIPNIITKRTNAHEKTTKNIWLLVLVLFSTPILIPLGVAYLSLMIVALSLIISGIAVMFGGVFAVIAQLVRALITGLALPEFMISLGLSLVAFAICLIVGYYLVKVSWWILQHLAIWFSKLIIRKKDTYEIH